MDEETQITQSNYQKNGKGRKEFLPPMKSTFFNNCKENLENKSNSGF